MTRIKGGSFLVTDIGHGDVFTPEDLSEDQLAVKKRAGDFIKNEVKPHFDRLLNQDLPLNREVLRKAGEAGLLVPDIGREYGGEGLDQMAATLLAGAFAEADVFSLTWNAHTCIGTLPIAIFGNRGQKEKFLPGLVRGDQVSAYALTEPSAGSDALGIQTRAVLSQDGRYYRLDGEKIFISNAGLADLFILYAKVDGDMFTAFIVERGFPGVSIGPELKKMGVRGSSTAGVTLRDVRVPVENVLYEVGLGYEVAFCILNVSRFRLAATCSEEGKAAIEESVKYAGTRIQFGLPITRFGLVQQKLADMAIKTYFSDSMVYRTADLLSQAYSGVDKAAPDYGKQMYQRLSAFTVEYSICKVFCSEALSFIADEAVQIYGGRGYIEGNLAERIYRDARINRIFEGTNEINRLLMVRWLLRKAAENEIPLFPLSQKLIADLSSPEGVPVSRDFPDSLVEQKKLVDVARKIFMLVCAAAARKYEKTIENEEEILGYLSNIMIEVYAMESGLLRAAKSVAATGEANAALKRDMVAVYVYDAMRRVEDWAVQTLAYMEAGAAPVMQLSGLRNLDTVAVRRRIAAAVIEAGQYVC